MPIRLYDTAARQIRPFEPLQEGKVGIYVCGATVQSGPHIGHLRPAIVFDILRRWLTRSGYDVTLIRNITDIDDKILAKAAEAGRPWWAHAARIEREFAAAYDMLGVLPPTFEPRATGHITDQIELVARLLEAGHAYVGDEGNVYFDAASWPEYGSLTNQQPGEMQDDEEQASDKKGPRDFALWKAPKPGEPDTASWPAPWGRGRPGWHLECTAMSVRYLGPQFDIHGGGLDLRFPHHENEQAQARAAGYPFARYWMHNGWVTQAGVKMSKSLGNTLTAEALLAQAPAVVLRYALTAGHYRSMIEFSDQSLDEAAATWERIEGFVERAGERVGQVAAAALATTALPAEFAEAMDDDLSVPEALAVVHEHVTTGNTALAELDDPTIAEELESVRAMLAVLGLDPLAEPWASDAKDEEPAHQALGALVASDLAAREEARRARDYAAADQIRDRLTAAGITIEDGPAGARWTLARPDGAAAGSPAGAGDGAPSGAPAGSSDGTNAAGAR